MTDKSLILYGAQNLSNNKLVTTSTNGVDTHQIELTRFENAREPGSSIVNDRLRERGFTLGGNIYAQKAVDYTNWQNGYDYRRTIVIDSDQVSGSANIANFPVAFSTTMNDLKTTGNGGKVTDSNGYDIIFTSDALGKNILSHEIDSYDGSTGAFIAHVLIPDLSYSSDTTIYMFYGNSSVTTSQEDTSSLWSGYGFVSHMNDVTTSTVLDSTGNDTTVSKKGAGEPAEAEGKISNGQDFDGLDDYIAITNSAAINPTSVTLMGWVNVDNLSNDVVIFDKYAVGNGGYRLDIDNTSGDLDFLVDGATDGAEATASSAISASTWLFVFATYDESSGDLSVEVVGGASGTNSKTTAEAIKSNVSGCVIGRNRSAGVEFIDGKMDELRIYGGVLSNGYRDTTYNNQSSPSTFYSIGDEYSVITSEALTLYDVIADYKQSLNKRDRFLRISKDWQRVFNLQDSTGWSSSNDTDIIYEDPLHWQYDNDGSPGSLVIDIDVSASGENKATLSKTFSSPIDLSDKLLNGNFETWVYLPDSAFITGVVLRIGNDSSNYYSSGSITQQYDNQPFEFGWNYISIAWNQMVETGAVDESALDYYSIDLEYDSDQADMTGIRFDSLLWQNDKQSRNFRSYVESPRIPGEHYQVTFAPIDIDLLAYKGYAEGTNILQVYEDTNITNLSETISLLLTGSYRPLPTITCTINSATDIDRLVLQNETTNTQITVSDDITTGSILIVDFEDRTIKQNGIQLAFDGILPIFDAGMNRLLMQFDSTANSYDIEQLTQNTEYDLNTSDKRAAQQFSTSATASPVLTNVSVYARNSRGIYPALMYVDVYTDSASEPGTLVGTVGFANLGTNTSFNWYPISCNVALSASTTYWLVARRGGTFTNDPMAWGKASSDAYASHLSGTSTDAGSSWSTGVNDFTFDLTITTGGTIDYDIDISYRELYL